MKNIYAFELGRHGGKKKSAIKKLSSKKNGSLGGRPCTLVFKDWVGFFDIVDLCRKKKTLILFKQYYLAQKNLRFKALVLSAVEYLSIELKISLPSWARESIILKQPYFVSQVENLKVSALLESPIVFKKRNVFVLNNFMNRV